jgi:RNA polymerase sigma-70 factor, ECF subfamily
MHRDDEALLLAAAAGDEWSFAALVRRHRPAVERFARRMLGDADAARDVAQDVFVRLWRAAGSYRAEGRFSEFLYTITRNVCRNHAARGHRECALDPSWDAAAAGPAPDADPSAQAEAQRALAGLPEPYREVLALTLFEGMSYAEAAEVLAVPRGTVASRKAAGVRMLRERLRGLLPHAECADGPTEGGVSP